MSNFLLVRTGMLTQGGLTIPLDYSPLPVEFAWDLMGVTHRCASLADRELSTQVTDRTEDGQPIGVSASLAAHVAGRGC